MKPTGEQFTVIHNGERITIATYATKQGPVYHVQFPNNSQLFITTTMNKDTAELFWTSIPEGNLELAGAIGKRIEEHFAKPIQNSLF